MELDVDVWQLKVENGDKMSVYTVFISQSTNIPVYYMMDGYNTLTGSHYDEYRVDYGVISTNFSKSVFDAPMAGIRLDS